MGHESSSNTFTTIATCYLANGRSLCFYFLQLLSKHLEVLLVLHRCLLLPGVCALFLLSILLPGSCTCPGLSCPAAQVLTTTADANGSLTKISHRPVDGALLAGALERENGGWNSIDVSRGRGPNYLRCGNSATVDSSSMTTTVTYGESAHDSTNFPLQFLGSTGRWDLGRGRSFMRGSCSIEEGR